MNDAAPASGYAEAYAAWRADPEAWWAGVAEGITWERRWDRVFDRLERAVRPLVPRRDAEHLLQLHRSPRAGRPRRAGGADLGQPDDRADRDLHLSPDADAHREARRRAGGTRRRAWRPGGDLPADGAGSGDRHAGLRAAGCDPFRGVRRLRRGRTGLAHRRRQAEGDRLGVLRARAGARGEIQAAARRGDRAVAAQARCLPDPAARCRTRRTGRRARPRSRGGRGGGVAARSGPRGGHRSALHPLHLGHDGTAEGRGARQWRPCGRAVELDAHAVRRRCRRRVLGGVRRRLGGRPLLHRLRAAAARLHQRDVRGQAGRHAGRRRVLAGLRAASA